MEAEGNALHQGGSVEMRVITARVPAFERFGDSHRLHLLWAGPRTGSEGNVVREGKMCPYTEVNHGPCTGR